MRYFRLFLLKSKDDFEYHPSIFISRNFGKWHNPIGNESISKKKE